jgi:Tat protein translocase TatB subunit
MNVLGIGPFELLLILVIATIVLGPERMAQTGRMLGRLYAQYRTRWQRDVDELTGELRRELEELQQEMEEIRQATEKEIRTAQDAFESVIDTKIDLEGIGGDSDTGRPSADADTEPIGAITPQAQDEEPTSTEVETGEVDS